MTNLQWLYETDADFAADVDGHAAEWLGTTSNNFAHNWLGLKHDGITRSAKLERLARDMYADLSKYGCSYAERMRECGLEVE